MNGEVLRMRLLASALIALATLTWSAAPTEARTRDQAQAQARQGAPQANRAAASRAATAPQRQAAARPTAARPTAVRQAAASPSRDARGTRQGSARRAAASPRDARGTRQAATRAGNRQQAAANCRGRNCAPRTRTVSWQGGLEPATNAQAHACPTGTLATLAHGHSNIVRCMPL
jgi:hypothetical protein